MSKEKFDEIKQKAKEVIENVADFSQETIHKAEETAKTLASRAKLTAAITRERTIIRRAQINIGVTYYKLHNEKNAEAKKALKTALGSYCDIISYTYSIYFYCS